MVGAAIVLSAGLLSACDTAVDTEEVPSTFESIQTAVFDQNCTTCHVDGSSFAAQSGLVLAAGRSYEQLVDVPPANSAARDDGLARVSSEGLAGLEKSYLWEKVFAPGRAHFLSDHPEYGAMMPLGRPPLTNGELDLIRSWIVVGAPRDSIVVNAESVLRDETRFDVEGHFDPLENPASGLALRLGPFSVAPNFERELFYYVPAAQSEDLFVDRVEISMRPGSHHFIAYTLADTIPAHEIPPSETYRDLRRPNGALDYEQLNTMQYHVFFAGTQWPRLDYEFPAGVALRLPAGQGLDLSTHYVNRGEDVLDGEVHLNLHTVPSSQVEQTAEQLALHNFNIFLPPNQTTTLKRTFLFSKRHHIFMLFSHAHEHMQEFRVYAEGGSRDGELVYVTHDWEHPSILELDPPLVLEAGEGLRLEATYSNWTNRPIRFGLQSTDEMMILFGYYWAE